MIVRQLEALPAGTLKRALGVAADSILADVLVIALVDVDAALSVLGERVALLALALEAPDGVATPAVVAHPELGAALVHIIAVVVGSQLESWTARAAVRTGHVFARSVQADTGASRALVQVETVVSVRRGIVARITGALEGPVQVDADTVLTDVRLLQAFVHILTSPGAGRPVAVGTSTFVTSGVVNALCCASAQSGLLLAFVDVFACEQARVVAVTGETVAAEAADRVGATSVLAHHSLTLVDVIQFIRQGIDDDAHG